MLLSRKFIIKALPEAELYLPDCLTDRDVGVSFDSRSVSDQELFVAFPGKNVDGHNFIDQALAAGAVGVLLSRKEIFSLLVERYPDRACILVDDVTEAIKNLTRAWRSELSIPVVAITGSVGKTSTKEMIKQLGIAAGRRVAASEKNENAQLGICRTILGTKQTDQLLVVEVGISQQGEMADRAALVRPTITVITSIGHAHTQGLASLEQVASEKRKLADVVPEHGTVILNRDCPLLFSKPYRANVITFGRENSADIKILNCSFRHADKSLVADVALSWFGEQKVIICAALHEGQVKNMLAVAAVAHVLEYPDIALQTVLQNPAGAAGRLEIIPAESGLIINDCYNANPLSMRAALESFDRLEVAGEKIAVLGDMLELGEKEIELHRAVGDYLNDLKSIKKVLLVGARAAHIGKKLENGKEVFYAASAAEAEVVFDRLGSEKTASSFLFKASRGVRLDRLVKQQRS